MTYEMKRTVLLRPTTAKFSLVLFHQPWNYKYCLQKYSCTAIWSPE